MKFAVNWLREFVELPSNTEELANLLTFSGIEIEGMQKRGANFDRVVVAQITASSAHPNADRLSVCSVEDGSGQARQIVCGAKNYKVGDKVPLALPGAVLTNELKIKESKLRGVESQGMLCSGTELGLSEDSSGLLILSPDAPVGAKIGSLFPEDTVLDVEITPNRGDLLSHFGLAREIAALIESSSLNDNGLYQAPSVELRSGEIRISAPQDCPFYSARRIENVVVGPSPEWLRARLEAVGQRSINNIVDITNFVMLETGQPLHAFDADKLTAGINVRLARKNESFLALDGKTYSLGENDLVIADDVRTVGIAGVMGGEDTGVTEGTKRVLLESAYFRPASVRQTARRLNLPSDSSYRFERGVDPAMILPASLRATELIRELASGNPGAEILTTGELPVLTAEVSLRYERCSQLIGLAVPKLRVDQILERFGLKQTHTDVDATSWRIPTYRSDLQREADLIEEVVRVFGIEHVPVSDRSRFTPLSNADKIYDFESDLRQRLVGRGLSEIRTSALIPRATGLFATEALELRNPLTEDHVALRPTLIPGLLEVVSRNVRGGASSIRLFELGDVFRPRHGDERKRLGLAFSGNTNSKPNWRTAERRFDLFDVKGVIETVGIEDLTFRRSTRAGFSISGDVSSGATVIGFIGQLAAAEGDAIGAQAPILFAEIELPDTLLTQLQRLRFREIEKFPSITRDIAMIVPENLMHADVVTCIEGAREPLLATIELFDLFSGKEAANLGKEKKSLAYTLTYRDKNRTLTHDEITVVHDRIRARLQQELGVELRE
jgi:phenylalanyl-tRNA synthetase beta chain